MTIKKTAAIMLCIILCLSFAACKAQPKDNPADNPPDLENPAVRPSDSSITELPTTTSIRVTREGMSESLPATLVSSNLGYSIYLLEDFVLDASNDGDIIRSSRSSALSQAMQVRIVNSDGLSPLPKNSEQDGMITEYRRIDKGALAYDAVLTYSVEAVEGGAVLMHAMLDTLTLTR